MTLSEAIKTDNYYFFRLPSFFIYAYVNGERESLEEEDQKLYDEAIELFEKLSKNKKYHLDVNLDQEPEFTPLPSIGLPSDCYDSKLYVYDE